MAATIRAGLVGVTGYTGMELTRILAFHPTMQLVQATSRTEAGKDLSAIYPFLQGMAVGNVVLTRPDATSLAAACDVVFLAIPHGAAMEMAAELEALSCKVVDLSADFRLNSQIIYTDWYKVEHSRPGLLASAVYGLPELNADAISNARLVANPGCYPTASILALYPALKEGLVATDDIVIDAKSGATGAGRGANVGMLYCEVADSFKAYSLAGHRHTPEIEQELGKISGKEMRVSFNPHLLPINRGILATIYTKPLQPVTKEEVHDLYTKTYARHEFIRVLPLGSLPEVRSVRGTMFCDIGIVLDPRTDRLILVSAIDNLCRGASGQAVANANLMTGGSLHDGLRFAPLAP